MTYQCIIASNFHVSDACISPGWPDQPTNKITCRSINLHACVYTHSQLHACLICVVCTNVLERHRADSDVMHTLLLAEYTECQLPCCCSVVHKPDSQLCHRSKQCLRHICSVAASRKPLQAVLLYAKPAGLHRFKICCSTVAGRSSRWVCEACCIFEYVVSVKPVVKFIGNKAYLCHGSTFADR